MDEYSLYEQGNSIPEVSALTGISRSTLRFRFNKKGILRSRCEGIRLAGKKERLGSGNRGKKRVFTEEWKSNISKGKIKHGEKHAKGISLKPNGYYEYTRGKHKWRLVHVVLMEEYLGRKIMKSEVVHHVNHVKTDNRIENLEVMTRNEHSRLHAKDNVENRKRDKQGKFK